MEIGNKASLIEMIDSDDAAFHYTKRSTALEIILSKNSFKLFRLLNTNDPREYKDRLLSVSGWDWKTDTEEQIKHVHKYYDSLLRNHSFFASFSVNKYNDGQLISKGYNKPRMWAQYGEDHYGICVVVSKQSLIDAIEDVIDKNEFCVFHDAISYTMSNRFLLSQRLSINGDSFASSTPFRIAFEHIEKHNKELFFQKDPDYRDEDEYRVVVCRTNDNFSDLQSLEIQASKIIRGIILGDRFPNVYKPTVEQLCDKLKIEYRKFHWEKREYILLNNL